MANRTPASLRLFYALWPDTATRDALLKLQAPLPGRKTLYQNFHLTLAFLGQQPAESVPLLTQILAAQPTMPITLLLDRIGYFKKNRIAWAGSHDTPPALATQQYRLVQTLLDQQITFNAETTFRAHVTLARDAPPPEELPFEPLCWRVAQLALVESVNQAGGVLYRPLAFHPLALEP